MYIVVLKVLKNGAWKKKDGVCVLADNESDALRILKDNHDYDDIVFVSCSLVVQRFITSVDKTGCSVTVSCLIWNEEIRGSSPLTLTTYFERGERCSQIFFISVRK